MNVIENDGLRFLYSTDVEVWRAQTLFTKEPGTIAWLNSELHEGDCFYDVGANIGAYTLYAARLVGPTGRVYAFEPHIGNAYSLMRNIEANGFADRVQVLTVALGTSSGLQPFQYRSLVTGSSGSQLGHAIGEDGKAFQPVLTEQKATEDLSTLIHTHRLRQPTLMKIDVDGNELDILWGAHWWVKNYPAVLRGLQVEVRATNRLGVNTWMQEHGYVHKGDHFTAQGQKAIAAGADAEGITSNAIFARAA